MRVVVTGAAGFIGSHLCERLLADDHDVVGIDSFTDFYPLPAKRANLEAIGEQPGFELRELDLLAPGLEEQLAGADAVCHLAGRPGVRDDDENAFEAGNVRTTEAVLRAAAGAGVPGVVYSSSSSVYAPGHGALTEDAPCKPLSPYGRSKLRAEQVAGQLADDSGTELVVLRFFTVYGPRQRPDMAFARFIDAALNSGTPMPLLGDGSQVRDFTYVGDAVEATIAALERGEPGTYNVAGGDPIALRVALDELSSQLGRAPEFSELPNDPREHVSIAADIGRARRELGYEPSTALAAGLARQVAAALAAAPG